MIGGKVNICQGQIRGGHGLQHFEARGRTTRGRNLEKFFHRSFLAVTLDHGWQVELCESVKAIVLRIKEYEEHMTPDLADVVERLVSAAFSPIPGRLQREDAEDALHETAASLVARRAEKEAAEQKKLEILREAAAAFNAAMEEQEEAMCAEYGRTRAAKRQAYQPSAPAAPKK